MPTRSDHNSGEKKPQKRRPGHPPMLSLEQQQQLREYVKQDPEQTIRQLSEGFSAEVGKRVPYQTFYNYLQRLGISYKKRERKPATNTNVTDDSEQASSLSKVRY